MITYLVTGLGVVGLHILVMVMELTHVQEVVEFVDVMNMELEIVMLVLAV